MRALIIVALCMLASPAWADMEARHEGDVLRITQEPCAPSVLAVIPQGSRGPFRKALATVGGLEYVACWALRTDGLVIVAYADGEVGLVPMAMFRVIPDA